MTKIYYVFISHIANITLVNVLQTNNNFSKQI